MAYKKTTWATGDVITADKMNNIEDGIASVTGADSPYSKDERDYIGTSMSQKGQNYITLRPDDFSELYAGGKVLMASSSDASISVETSNSSWNIYKYELGRAFVLRADHIVKNANAAGCVPIAFRYKGVDYSVDYDRLGGYYIADTVLVSYNAMNEAYAIEEFSFTETVRQEFSDSIICRDHAGEFDSLVVFGDSIFANTISNPDTGALTNNGNGVTKQLADLMGVPLYKHAVNNATLSTKYTTVAQNVVKQIQDYIANPDSGSRPLFIIEGGTNDGYHYGISNLGTYGSSDTTTIYGAIYYAINLLLSIEGVQPWQILVCTPIPKGIRALWDGTAGFSSAGWLANTDLELTTIGHAMYEIALNRQCSVINGYNAIFDELSSSYICQLMMGDDTHPTVYGSERYARYIYDTLFSGASTKEVEEDIASLKSAVNVVMDGGSFDFSVVPTIVTGIGINARSGAEATTTAYNATGNVSVPNGATTVTVKASFNDSLGTTFYDENGTHIANSGAWGFIASQFGGTNTSVPQTFVISVPDNAATMRSCIRSAYYSQPSDIGIVFHCTRESAYDYADDKVTTLKAYTDTADFALNQSIKDIADIRTGANLVDPDTVTVGAIQSNGTISTTGSYANYSTSDFIPVTAGESYHLGVFAKSGNYYSASRKLYLLYNSSKTPITSTWVNTTAEAVITPAQDGYIRVSWPSTGLVMLIVGTEHTTYEAYYSQFSLNDTFSLTSEMESQIAAISGNILSAKKWAHCGDSFSDYTNKTFSEGKYLGRYASFPRLIAERNDMNLLQDFMLSGRTLAFPANPGTFVNALTAPGQTYNYQNIPADVDYVTIMLGINDCQHTGSGSTGDGEDATGEITLGTINDTTTATYYGAYNTVCAWLRENRPFAHVGIIVTNGTIRQDYTEAQIAIAKKWGYPYINLNGDERTPAFIRCYNPDIPTALKESLKTIQGVDAPSNTHPNWQTHELESTIIEAWLRTL